MNFKPDHSLRIIFIHDQCFYFIYSFIEFLWKHICLFFEKNRSFMRWRCHFYVIFLIKIYIIYHFFYSIRSKFIETNMFLFFYYSLPLTIRITWTSILIEHFLHSSISFITLSFYSIWNSFCKNIRKWVWHLWISTLLVTLRGFLISCK